MHYTLIHGSCLCVYSISIEIRDKGFTQPKVLILVPFRYYALEIVNTLIDLFPTNARVILFIFIYTLQLFVYCYLGKNWKQNKIFGRIWTT